MDEKLCNGIEFLVEADAVGIRDWERYEIEDNKKTYAEWKKLQSDFAIQFKEFSPENRPDYEFADWHHGSRRLSVYLYNEKFYNKYFVPKILKIIYDNPNSFAEFECYNDKDEMIGSFQIYEDKIIFDNLFEESGYIKSLCQD
ncbi:MAG: hypothetical protein ABIJ59_17860 [Pseudomonadota bacterium]